jgi:hypothetical protein
MKRRRAPAADKKVKLTEENIAHEKLEISVTAGVTQAK